jgi:nucleoside-diphosphate-sugar epimerase
MHGDPGVELHSVVLGQYANELRAFCNGDGHLAKANARATAYQRKCATSLPDVARSMVTLIAMRETLSAFETFHMNGHWDHDGTQMTQAIQRVVVQHGGQRPKIAAFPWWLMPVVALFSETVKEMLEMRYLWETNVRMDNAKLKSLLGREPMTPLDEAVEVTLRGQGCLSSLHSP